MLQISNEQQLKVDLWSKDDLDSGERKNSLKNLNQLDNAVAYDKTGRLQGLVAEKVEIIFTKLGFFLLT